MTTREFTPRRRIIGQAFEERVRKGVATRGAFPFLVLATASLTVGAGLVARLTDPRDFHSLGDALWWSIVTLATVGYGDIVPETAWGRIIGTFVMLLGVTFISFLTATVTSLFVSSEEGERERRTVDREAEIRAILQRIEDRLAAIEDRVAQT